MIVGKFYFNPRAPCGARRHIAFNAAHVVGISILAPRAGRDVQLHGFFTVARDFNPRAPCGARRSGGSGVPLLPIISILAPRAGRDFRRRFNVGQARYISILAPRAGRDASSGNVPPRGSAFQSSRPVRGATCVIPPYT